MANFDLLQNSGPSFEAELATSVELDLQECCSDCFLAFLGSFRYLKSEMLKEIPEI